MNGPGGPVKKEVGRWPAALPEPFHWGAVNSGLVKKRLPVGPVYGTLRMFIPLKLFVTLLGLTIGWDNIEPYMPDGSPPTGPWFVGVICVPNGVVDRAVRPDRGAFWPEIPTGPRASSLPVVKVICAMVPNPVNALSQTRHFKDFMLLHPVSFDPVRPGRFSYRHFKF